MKKRESPTGKTKSVSARNTEKEMISMESLEQINEKEILKNARIGLWRVEFEGKRIVRFYGNAVMDELLGIQKPVTAEERLAFFFEHIHPDDKALFQEYVNKLTEVCTEIVYRYIHPASGEMMVRCGGSRDMSVKNYISVTGIHQDISGMLRLEKSRVTERWLTEQNITLRKEQVMQEDYYRDLLDVQNCGLLAYTLPGHRVIHMNKEALRMYGVKDIEEAQHSLGIILSKVHYPEPEVREKLRRLRSEDVVVDYECIINQGQKNECHAMAKTKAIYMPNGERAAVTTFIDVSDMMMLKRALQQAKEGSEAKSAFLFAMSHDLRTPMNAIIGYAELLEAHWGEKEITWDYLQKLKVASQFLLTLIGNVLEVSRIENGKETMHETVWNPRKLSETMDILLRNEIERKNLDITRHIQLSHTSVMCDVAKIREILMNLMSNAVKYTPAGGKIHLTIDELPAQTSEQIILRLRVEDNGMGIAKDYLPHLFEAFSREKDSAQSGIMGTGLGLRIVKSFVDLMHGTIEVESTQGEGSCFTVEIPLRLASEAECRQAAASVAKQVSLAGKRILLAEDNALNAEITTTILKDTEIYVELAENGAEAVCRLQEAPIGYYDLILMDIQMPVMNGYQAARTIRELPDARAKIPIVAMTANAFEEDRQAAFDAGMNAYAAKPIEVAKLLNVLAQTLDVE
ncbi:MAG: ATP-binding protein [Clostridia bacterium]|nr:ATP-binding protein [Clostridia bacterium]